MTTHVIVHMPLRRIDYGTAQVHPKDHPYHYPKFSDYHDPRKFKRALRKSGLFIGIETQRDFDKDPVAFWFTARNVATVRNFVVRILGINHGLLVAETGSARAGRRNYVKFLRAERDLSKRRMMRADPNFHSRF